MMNRREALQLLATGAALQLAPAKMLAVLREARAVLGDQSGSDSTARTLDAHQTATVKAMAEMILPRTDTPGAADVGASDFIDLMLREWYGEAARERFLTGLSRVDARSQDLFHNDFVECSSIQQAAILNALGAQMTEEQLAPDRASIVELASEGSAGFYFMLRWLTLTAYYTSEAGATQELHFQIIPDRHSGCEEITLREERPEPR